MHLISLNWELSKDKRHQDQNKNESQGLGLSSLELAQTSLAEDLSSVTSTHLQPQFPQGPDSAGLHGHLPHIYTSYNHDLIRTEIQWEVVTRIKGEQMHTFFYLVS